MQVQRSTAGAPLLFTTDLNRVGIALHDSPLVAAFIRESIDSLCRDGTDMRRDAHNMKSFQTHRVGNSKPFKALYHATEVLLYLSK